MAAAGSLAWRPRFPGRALRRLGWYVFGSGAVVVGSWVLFGSEPGQLGSGDLNLLATLPAATGGLAAAGAVPFAVALIRRPLVEADHYALQIRPGMLRTLLLPWAAVAEVAAVEAGDGQLLLVRCRPGAGTSGDRPRWWDQAVLRAAGRVAAGYHLAVRIADFTGDSGKLVGGLAGWAPARVMVRNQLAPPPRANGFRSDR